MDFRAFYVILYRIKLIHADAIFILKTKRNENIKSFLTNRHVINVFAREKMKNEQERRKDGC